MEGDGCRFELREEDSSLLRDVREAVQRPEGDRDATLATLQRLEARLADKDRQMLLVEEMWEARRLGQWRDVWRLASAIAGRPFGARAKLAAARKKQPASVQQWVEKLWRPGADGGCRGDEVDFDKILE